MSTEATPSTTTIATSATTTAATATTPAERSGGSSTGTTATTATTTTATTTPTTAATTASTATTSKPRNSNGNSNKDKDIAARVAAVSRERIVCDGCGVAKNPKLRCSRCCGSYYCSRQCQAQHWPAHKKGVCYDKVKRGIAFQALADETRGFVRAEPPPLPAIMMTTTKTSTTTNTTRNDDTTTPSSTAAATKATESRTTNDAAAAPASSTDSKKPSTASTTTMRRRPENEECPICLKSPIEHTVVLERCRHAFCSQCLIQWQYPNDLRAFIVDKSRATCPCCRERADDVYHLLVREAKCCLAQAEECGGDDDDDGDNDDDDTAAAEKKKKAALFATALRHVERALSVDFPHLQAWLTKAEIQLKSGDPRAAIDTLDDVRGRMHDLNRRQDPISALKLEADQARKEGDWAKARQIYTKVMALVDEENIPSLSVLGYSGRTVMQMMILLGECYIALEDYKQALSIFAETWAMKDNFDDSDSPGTTEFDSLIILDKIMLGVCRCWYGLGEYEKCIEQAKDVVGVSRMYAGFHKYLALAYKALGQLDEAQLMAATGVLYEAPWNEQNKLENLDLYEQLLVETTAAAEEEEGETSAGEEKKVD